MKKLLENIGLFEANLSAVEWLWRIVVFVVVAAGGTTGGLLAKSSSWFSEGGALAWFCVAIFCAVAFSIILYLVKLASFKSAQAEYTRSMASIPVKINPLLTSFEDQIIRLEDLRLPGQQLHENKIFKRCKFVGPGAVALLGGTFNRDSFIECGDMVVLADGVFLTGIIALKNCIVEDSEFYRVTNLVPRDVGIKFKQHMGANVPGL